MANSVVDDWSVELATILSNATCRLCKLSFLTFNLILISVFSLFYVLDNFTSVGDFVLVSCTNEIEV